MSQLRREYHNLKEKIENVLNHYKLAKANNDSEQQAIFINELKRLNIEKKRVLHEIDKEISGIDANAELDI